MLIDCEGYSVSIIRACDGEYVDCDANKITFTDSDIVPEHPSYMGYTTIYDETIIDKFCNEFEDQKYKGRSDVDEVSIIFSVRDITSGTKVAIGFFIQDGDGMQINEYLTNVVIFNDSNLVYKVAQFANIKKFIRKAAIIIDVFEMFKSDFDRTPVIQNYRKFIPGFEQARSDILQLAEKIIANVRSY
jgi:hypothetical protein